jgi:hypothetical protein
LYALARYIVALGREALAAERHETFCRDRSSMHATDIAPGFTTVPQQWLPPIV